MTTVAAPASPAKPARKPARPAHGMCRLDLTINGTSYGVRPIDCATDRETIRAWRLRKAGTSTAYDAAETVHGLTCDCPDFTFHRDGIDPAGCKHVKALCACGLLTGPDPDPDPEPTPDPEPDGDGFAEELVEAVPAAGPAKPSTPAEVDAIAWATMLTGRRWDVATAEQREYALEILNNDSGTYSGCRIAPPGPSLAELADLLAARDAAPAVGPAPAPAETDEVRSCPASGKPMRRLPTGGWTTRPAEVAAPAACCDPAEPTPCRGCAADAWPSTEAIDGQRWTITAADDDAPVVVEPIGHDDDGGRLSLAAVVHAEANRVRAGGERISNLMADWLDDLGRRIGRVGAETLEQYFDRWAALDAPGKDDHGPMIDWRDEAQEAR